MEKNMKKIIHASCLILLLLTCNEIIGKNGTTEAIVPRVHFGTAFLIQEASVKLDRLTQQTNKKQQINPRIYNEVQKILKSYFSEKSIEIRDENNDCIGTCDTKGWKKDKDTREEVEAVQRKLALLAQNYTDEATLPRFSTAFPIQEAFLDIQELIKRKKIGKRINRHTYNRIKNTLTSYSNQESIAILDENNRRIGTSDTKNWKENKDIREKVKAVKQYFALLATPKFETE